jgi:hypothetical protein
MSELRTPLSVSHPALPLRTSFSQQWTDCPSPSGQGQPMASMLLVSFLKQGRSHMTHFKQETSSWWLPAASCSLHDLLLSSSHPPCLHPSRTCGGFAKKQRMASGSVCVASVLAVPLIKLYQFLPTDTRYLRTTQIYSPILLEL